LVPWRPTENPVESGPGLNFEDVVLGVGVAGTGFEPVPDVAVSGVREEPLSEPLEEVFSSFDDFERVADNEAVEPLATPSEPSQTKTNPQTQTEDGVRRKRFKTLVGRLDLPHVHKCLAARAKASGITTRPKQLNPKPSTTPTRKSFRLASQSTTKSTSSKQDPIVVEDLDSSAESNPASEPQTPVTEQGPPMISTSKPSLKRKAIARKTTHKTPDPTPLSSPEHGPSAKSPVKPKVKKAKTTTSPPPNLDKFLKQSVVRGKVVKIGYFQEQGLEVFLDKLTDQGWLELLTNNQMGCSQPELAEFYARVVVTEEAVTSEVNGVKISFDARRLVEILGISSMGFDLYVWEDKTLLGRAKLLELVQTLSQNPELTHPQALKKGDMTPMHQLLFWFIIKNIIPRGQGRH